MDMASDEEASIFPALHPQTQMETDDEPHQPRPPQSHAIEVTILHPDGSQLSLSLSTGLNLLPGERRHTCPYAKDASKHLHTDLPGLYLR